MTNKKREKMENRRRCPRPLTPFTRLLKDLMEYSNRLNREFAAIPVTFVFHENYHGLNLGKRSGGE